MNKDRVTHDQSFPVKFSNTSVNRRVRYNKLLTCFYGHMNRRTIHYIVGCRLCHPHRQIWISKIDWKSAYRRQIFNSRTAVKLLTQVVINRILLLLAALRLMFGGKHCPIEWGCISETVADLATNILHCNKWDPFEIQAPPQPQMPYPKPLPQNLPFAAANSLFVEFPPEDKVKVDVYIDDTIGIAPDLPGIAPRLQSFILLAFHLVFRPISESKPIPHDEAATITKLIAEGVLEETKLILWWLYYTRRLIISLPNSKYIA